MIITVVCDILGVENNGVAVVMLNLIRYLKSEGHTVRILCADQSKIGQENYYVVPPQSFGKTLDRFVSKVGVQLAKADKKVIVEALTGADFVHIIVPLGLGLASAKIAHKMNLPVTAGFHMQAENLTGYLKLHKIKPINTFVYKYIYKHCYRYCDGIHYPTKFIRDTFESRIKKQTPGYVISNGVHSYIEKKDVDKPAELRDKIVILSTGRYSVEKSQDTLIKAVAHSAGVDTEFKFFARDEIVNVLNYCDLYVHPAVYELEGIACLESIACGKMTIVSDSVGSATKDFAVDEKCVFKHKNAKDLAKVIDYWIEHDDEKKAYESRYLQSKFVYRQEECMKLMGEMIDEVALKHNEKRSDRVVVKE